MREREKSKRKEQEKRAREKSERKEREKMSVKINQALGSHKNFSHFRSHLNLLFVLSDNSLVVLLHNTVIILSLVWS